MKNFKLPLEKHLHSLNGKQPKVSFSMSNHYYEINGEHFNNPLRELFTREFKGYKSNVMNNFVFITLFYDEDILRRF